MFLTKLLDVRRIKQCSLVLLLSSGPCAFAHELGAQIGLQDDQVTITGSGASAGFSQLANISANGTVSTVVNVPSTNGVGIPSFAFTLVSSATSENYHADFRVGIIIQDKNVPGRRFEAEIPKLSLRVDEGEMTGTIPNSQSLVAKARNGAGTIEVSVSIPNNSQNGPITISGGTVTMSATSLLSRVRSANSLFDSIILAEFDQPASYEYWIAVKESGTATAVRFGKTTGGFAVFTGQPAAAPFALLRAADYSGGYFVKGEFNVVLSASSGGATGGGESGGASEAVTQETDGLEAELAAIPLIDSAVVPTADTLAKIATAVNNAGNIVSQAAAAAAAGTLTGEQAIATLLQTNKAVELAGQAKQAGGSTSASASISVLTNIASVFSGLSSSGTALNGFQKIQLATEAKKAIDNAKALIKEGEGGTTQSELIALVDAGAQLLNKMSGLNGNKVPDDVLASVNTLSTTAIANSLQGLDAAQGINRNDPIEVRNFLQSNVSAKQKALETTTVKVEPILRFSVSIGSANIQDCPQLIEQVTQDLSTNLGIPVSRIALAIVECQSQGSNAAILSGEGNLFAATASPTITIDDAGILTYSTNNEKYVARTILRIVPSSFPEGTSTLANGKILVVGAGIANEVSPTAFDEVAFGQAVSSAGFQLTYKDNGSIFIALGNNESFSGAFAYDSLGTASSCGAVTFVAPVGSPASADYAFVASCADGARQRITPFTNASGFYTSLANAGMNASTDRNTGIVSIASIGSFKPSFFVTALSSNDAAFFEATKNIDGIAFRATDANADGKTDYEIISTTGVQLMYGL